MLHFQQYGDRCIQAIMHEDLSMAPAPTWMEMRESIDDADLCTGGPGKYEQEGAEAPSLFPTNHD